MVQSRSNQVRNEVQLNPLKFEIVEMQEADLREVVEIEEVAGLSRWGYDTYRRELLTNPDAIMLVARTMLRLLPQRRIIGFLAAWIVADEMHINNIGILPDYRRQGVGQTLLKQALRQGQMLGASYCLLEVRFSNRPAIELYEKLGFVTIDRRRNYYSLPIEDALVMQKRF